jgi:uncharacterized protein (DUF1684 family)
MKKSIFVSLVLLLCALPLASASQDQNWRADLLRWRSQRAKHLTAPEGWMSLVALDWLKAGDNSFGSAADNAIVISKLPAHAGRFHLETNGVTLLPPVGGFPGDVLVDGQAPHNSQTLVADDSAKPSKITSGTLAILIIHRGDRFGVRVKDAKAPEIVNFHGLHWYAPNPAYRINARWIPYNPAKQISVPTVIGTTENYPVPGVAEFVIDGKTVRLEPVIEEPGDKQLFFILRDTTSQTSTYGASRFLYTDFPDHGLSQPGNLLIDFNRLENPPCAYTPYATCPLPPPQNRLQVAIPAGEKRYHK